MPIHWLSLSAMVDDRRKAVVSRFLLDRGATGLTEHHDALNFHDGEGPLISGDPDEWKPPPPAAPDSRVRITGWFADEGQAETLHAGLTEVLDDLGESEDAVLTVVPDQDWNAEWKKSFAPTRISEGVWVVPSWCEPPPESAGDLLLKLDPGMAFGTGTHPTTARCVTLIRDELGKRTGATLLDVGTGTGILAIAGLHLGVTTAVGVDPDRNSVTAARENADLNGVGDRFSVHAGSADQAPGDRYDLVVANLIAPLLVRLADSLCARVASGGVLIVSGLLDRQRPAVVRAFAERGLVVERELAEAGWSAMLLRETT
jgi:ribosomal protein L11 methyltransferase